METCKSATPPPCATSLSLNGPVPSHSNGKNTGLSVQVASQVQGRSQDRKTITSFYIQARMIPEISSSLTKGQVWVE